MSGLSRWLALAALGGVVVVTTRCSSALMLEVLNASDRAVRIEASRQGEKRCDLPPGGKCVVEYALEMAISSGPLRWEYQMPTPRFSNTDADIFLERRGFYGPDVLPVRFEGTLQLRAARPGDGSGRVNPQQPPGFPVHPSDTRE